MKQFTKKHVVFLAMALLSTVTWLSCSIDDTATTEGTAPSSSKVTNIISKINSIVANVLLANKAEAANTKSLILLTNKDVDEEKLAQELNATVIDSLIIEEKKYIKITSIEIHNAHLRKHKQVLAVEHEQMRQSFIKPTDPYYTKQYAPQLTGLESVWDTYTGSGVTVAVLDTGINTLHEDFGGTSAFVAGWDYSENIEYSTTSDNDEHGHGTHVAGIIGARINDKGIVGVAPEATIMPIRGTATGVTGVFSSFAIAQGIKYAVENGADIINLSLGGLKTTSIEGEAISYAIKQGVVVIAASGNDGLVLKSYPASYPGVISVASSNGNDEISGFSTRSPHISVAAPGENIYSLYPILKTTTLYNSFSGTSMATPFVSGVAALLLQKFPTATPAQIKQILENTAKDIETFGYDFASGHGRVAPVEALNTDTLPSVAWSEIEYTVSYETKKLEGYAINILDDKEIFYTSALTNVDGVASFFLPKGTYTASSAYYGVPKIEALTVQDNAQATKISSTIQYNTTDFSSSNFYRVSTYFNAQEVDTVLIVFKLNNGTDAEIVSFNNNKSNTDIYSEVLFPLIDGEYYVFTVSPVTSDSTGNYRILLEKGMPITQPTSTEGSNVDETNDNDHNAETIVLTIGKPRFGTLAQNDIDVFWYPSYPY